MVQIVAQQKYITYWFTRSLLPNNFGKLGDSFKDSQADLNLRKSDSKKTSRLEGKVRLQRLIKDLEKRRSEKWLNLYQAQDEIDEKKEPLLAKVEAMLAKKIEQTKLITFHWRIV